MKLADGLYEKLKTKVGIKFPGRGYSPETLKKEDHFQLWTSLGPSKGAIHYEYYEPDDEVQLHFENWEDDGKGNFIGNHFLREGLIEATKDIKGLKWDTWPPEKPRAGKNCRCIYDEKMSLADKSVDEIADRIIEGFESLIDKFDKLILKIIRNNAMEEYIKLLENNYNLILTGAPGTGKTYLARQIAATMGAETAFVQFHPSYDYTDFVEGLRPNDDGNGHIGFIRMDGVFKDFCKKALKNSEKKFVFIIDEINRGDISKILGELFFSIDPGYRGEDGMVQTQYQNLINKGSDDFDKGFYVPKNVYIIGTMNDIDRSVESMDFAMRRRFAWKEINATDRVEMLNKLGEKENEAVDRMNNLNTAIENTEGLSKAYHIGASYFLKLNNYNEDSDGGWKSLWDNNIKGLLYEYLRGSEKIGENIEKLYNAYNNPNLDTNEG